MVMKGRGQSKSMKKSAKVAPAAAAPGATTSGKSRSEKQAADHQVAAHGASTPPPTAGGVQKAPPPHPKGTTSREDSAATVDRKGGGSSASMAAPPLGGKSYLSKSHENLASALRRKVAGSSRQRPLSWVGGPPQSDSAAAAVPPSTTSRASAAAATGRSSPSMMSAVQRSSKTVYFASNDAGAQDREPEGEDLAEAAATGAGSSASTASNDADGATAGKVSQSRGGEAVAPNVQSLLRPTASSLQKAVPSSKQQQTRETPAAGASSAATVRQSSSIPRLSQTVTAAAVMAPSSTASISSSSSSSTAYVTGGARAAAPMNLSSSLSLSARAAVIKKSSSIQNLSKQSQSVLRRVSSTHNVGAGRGGDNGRRGRAATASSSTSGSSSSTSGQVAPPPSSAVAYNVELLASFEKEKRVLEGRISGLVQITESRKAEIEKLKIETRNLQKRLPSREVLDELDKALNENRLLRDRLQELGVCVEQITDSEKLSMLSSSAMAAAHQRGGRSGSSDNLFEVDDLDVVGSRHLTGSLVAAASSRKSDSSGNLLDDGDYCNTFDHGTPDHPSLLSAMDSAWDKQSNKSSDGNSEVSVACLQDRILQMEETHYSTNEELQATLQELGDLQQSVNQLSEENEHLTAEKTVLLQSLCAQTEKLENARTQIEHLKALVLSDMSSATSLAATSSGESCGSRGPSHREAQLAGLLRSAQEEREELVLRQRELSSVLTSAERNLRDARSALAHTVSEGTRMLEEQRAAHAADRRLLEEQLAVATDRRLCDAGQSGDHHCCKGLLELEGSKEPGSGERPCEQPLQPLAIGDSSSGSALERLQGSCTEATVAVAAARLEKEHAEQRIADLQEALALSQREVSLLREQHAVLEEELQQELQRVRADADKSCVVSELEYKCEQACGDADALRSTCEQLREDLERARKDAARALDESKGHRLAVSDLQAELKGAKHRYTEFEKEMKVLSLRHEEEAGEWRQFQSDLQMAVVIANAIKTEAEETQSRSAEENDKLRVQNEDLQKQVAQLQQEVERLKWPKSGSSTLTGPTSTYSSSTSGGSTSGTSVILSNGDATKGRIFSSVDGSTAALQPSSPARRLSDKKAGYQSASVKTLIKSIEGQGVVTLCSNGTEDGGDGMLLKRVPSVDGSSSAATASSPVMSVYTATKPLAMAQPAVMVFEVSSSPRPSPERRSSVASGEVQLKSALKKTSAAELAEKKVRPHSSSFVYDKASLPLIEPTDVGKVAMVSSRSVSEPDKVDAKRDSKDLSKADPLANLVKQTGGSKRNALLKWCQQKTVGYRSVDVTNFSSSWNDGLAFCALLHGYMPDRIPYDDLANSHDKKRNFTVAFQAAESVGIISSLNVSDMVCMERPDWQSVMLYVTDIYKHFEFD